MLCSDGQHGSLNKADGTPIVAAMLLRQRSLEPPARTNHAFELERASVRSKFPTMLSTGPQGNDERSSRISYMLSLHFLGIAGLPSPGWLERLPSYELILQAGSSCKRLRPRIPAPPVGTPCSGGIDETELRDLLPGVQSVLRLDERLAMRLAEPASVLQIEVWEEKTGLLSVGAKAPQRQLVGHCSVPLEQKFSRRRCTWSIVQPRQGATGYLVLKFGLATSPAAVRNLRIVEGVTRATEVRLEWDPPVSDGGTPLRGYRVEAIELQDLGPMTAGGFLSSIDRRTASAPASPEPTVTLASLQGNTVYTFRVWAVSEAGPGPVAEVMGKSGPVPPGVCGQPRAAEGDAEAPLCIEWSPPLDGGGAAVVAYRVWLRPLFRDSVQEVMPANGFIDLGLFEHRGAPSALQRAPFRLEALPKSCFGCLCSVAALNAAGHIGPSTEEAPVFWTEENATPSVDIWEVGPGEDLNASDQGPPYFHHEGLGTRWSESDMHLGRPRMQEPLAVGRSQASRPLSPATPMFARRSGPSSSNDGARTPAPPEVLMQTSFEVESQRPASASWSRSARGSLVAARPKRL